MNVIADLQMAGDMSVAASTEEQEAPEVTHSLPDDIQEKVDNLGLDLEPSGNVLIDSPPKLS